MPHSEELSGLMLNASQLINSGGLAPAPPVIGADQHTFGLANGAANLPSLYFINDPDSGIYSIGANNIGITVNGAKVVDIASTGIIIPPVTSGVAGLTVGQAPNGDSTFQVVGGSAGTGLRICFNGTAVNYFDADTQNFRTAGGAATFTISTTSLTASIPITTKGYTVATLPAGTVGMLAHVTDALAPTFLGVLVGGGAVRCPAFYNGTNWIAA